MRSFRRILALRTAASVSVLAALVGAASVLGLRVILYRQLDDTLLHLAEVEAQAGAARQSSQFEFHEGVLLSARNGAGPELTRYAQLWSSRGEALVRSRNLAADLYLPAASLARARDGLITWDTHRWLGDRIRCVVYPLELVGPTHGVHLLQVAAPLAPVERTVTRFAALVLLGVLATGAAAFVVGGEVAGMALRPTAEITRQAEAIHEGSLGPGITAHAETEEFSRLVRVLNGMLRRLQEALEGQRRFTSDASHELRGPLTALRGDIDLALRRERTPAEYRETLERCRAEVARLARTTTDLLTLARSDGGLPPEDRVAVELRQVAERVAARYQALASERGVRLRVEGAPGAVRGDPGLLERLVGNLVENGLKHSPPAGEVRLTVAGGGPVTLTVRDQGPGVPPDLAPRLFNRFARGPHGGGQREGTGLGLAIARAVAEAHGGRLEFLGNAPGAVFELTLPAATGSDHA